MGRHLASILAHSLALCADPIIAQVDDNPTADDSPPSSTPGSRNASIPSLASRSSSIRSPSIAGAPELQATETDIISPISIVHVTFPKLSEAKRFKLIGSLQSWTFNAMGYSSDELLGCVGIIFESVRNMEGVDFDLGEYFLIGLQTFFS